MKRQLYRITLCSILTYLALSAPNLAGAASQPSEGNGPHFCGFTEQPDNRRYTRAFAPNLNVGEPRTVRLIYFTPNDQPYRADVVQRMKDQILNIQTFYAEQMEVHGYGEVTFRVETDSQGEPIVHRVDGDHPDSYYISDLAPVFEESERAFNLKAYISLIVLDNGGSSLGDGQAAGLGELWGKNSGYAVVTGDVDFGVTAHELGHAFGLEHDFRDGAYIMSYGPGWNQLSACSAEYLSVHPYFNSDIPIERGHSPTIELISPRTYSAGSRSVPIRFQVNASRGLHQVLLRGLYGLIECRGLAGETDALVEFNYDGAVTLQGLTLLPDAVAHGFFVEAVDTDGNWSARMSFFLTESSPHHIAILEGHTAWLHSVSFSPDGRTLASGGEDQTVKLWDVVTQQDIGTLPHGAGVTSVAFSPVDATLLATGSKDGTVKLWDVETQQDIGTLPHGVGVTSVAFSRDGMLLASGSRDGTVKLWEVTTQQDIGTLPHGAGITSVAFSRDGMLLASGSQDRTVKLWDVATRQNIGTLDGHSIWVYSVSFSPDGTILASTGGNTVKLWDVTTQRNIGILPHGADVGSVSFSRDGGTLASGAVDGTVKLWDVASGANFATLGNTSGVNSLSFSSDGVTLASGTAEGMIELWDTSGLIRERLEAVAEIDIPDPNLRAAIATALGKPQSASIVRGNMATLTWLEASKAGINNLTGLEGSTKLTSLNLWGNNISDISAVAGLTNLRTLNLAINSVSDISAVAGLTNLTRLFLGNNSVSDISAVAGLTNLRTLNLNRNSISDISPLVENTGLAGEDDVHLRGNPLNYQSIHTHIPALQSRRVTVEFDNRTATTLLKISGAVSASNNVLTVEVRDSNGRIFEGVPVTFTVTSGGGTLSATNTTTDENGRAQSTLTVGKESNRVTASAVGTEQTVTFSDVAEAGVHIPDPNLRAAIGAALDVIPGDPISPEQMATLTHFRAKDWTDGDSISLLIGLEFATNLTELRLGNNSITDVTPLSGLTNLTNLHLSHNRITDISFLSGLNDLTELRLSGNNIVDISPLSGLTGLTNLHLSYNRITDISPLSGLTDLTELRLSGNNITDISPLSRLTNLRTLDLPSGIQDLPVLVRVLARLPHLISLGLSGNNLEDVLALIPVLSDLTGLRDLNLSGTGMTDLSPLTEFTHLTGLHLWGNNISDISPVADLRNLTTLSLGNNSVSDISPVADLRNLTTLSLGYNSVSDISPVAGLTNLTSLNLWGNNISDISPLVENTGFGRGGWSWVGVRRNPLSYQSIHTHIPALQNRGVTVDFDNQAHAALLKISGDNQRRTPGETLVNPFVVEVQDESGLVLAGISVTFIVTSGDGMLSIRSATTNANGRAQSTLTLGPNLGRHTVQVSAVGIEVPATFNAEGNRIPETLDIISGADQEGLPGDALEKPFVVEVRDEFDKPLPGAQVTFTVTSGDGTLSEISVTTDSNGRAESTLTLGPEPGTNTVEATVTGIEEKRAFNAEGTQIPKTLEIVSGAEQEGIPGDVLEKPFVVEVQDQTDKPLPGAKVTFSVTSGDGTLSATSGTTDSNGRVASTLTLGPNPGTNTVTVSVTGSQETRTFNAEGIRIPKTLEIISGVDQAGLPGDVLEKPFVVEVRDQTDKPLPGVEVTFTVTAGGGTVQPEIATTDENGRAESTLTLGSTPGANTVRVSVEGNTQAVAFLTIETARMPMFTLAIPAGAHAIHIPLAVRQINGEDAVLETVGDLYNALGDAVSYIITVGDDGGWKTYLGSLSAGTKADAAIGDDTGLIVVMSDGKTLELVGDALGTGGASMINIDVGNNLVGLPLKPAAGLSMISDLLGDGVGAIAVSKADGMGFHTIREPGQDGDGPIVGGVGYLVVYIGTEATSIPIVGSAWKNTGAVSAAPAVAFDGSHTPVLYVEGGVMDEFNMLARAPELRVTVKNLSTGASLDTVLGTELSATAYSVTFVELSRHAAKAGDVLEIVAHATNPFVGVRPVPQIVVSAEEVLTSRIKLPDLELYEIPSETELLANYPNPFNPETWIPYQLAEDADVTLTIYDTKGVTVRRLDLGHQLAGYYADRGKAAYWDGRNDNGESVASGLYFYQLGTPSFSHVRRMAILK